MSAIGMPQLRPRLARMFARRHVADAQIGCEISSINQTLDTVNRLTVTYSVSGMLEGGVLLFGPLPSLGITQCDAPSKPSVRFGSESAVEGIDGDGRELWATESASPATAFTGEGTPIRLGIARVDG